MLCVSVYVCLYLCVHVHSHVCTQLCIHIHVCVCVCMCIRVYAGAHLRGACVHLCECVCIAQVSISCAIRRHVLSPHSHILQIDSS